MAKKSFFILCGILFLLLILTPYARAQSLWQDLNNPATSSLWGVHFINNDTGFVVGENGQLFKTKDGGNNWNALNSGVNDHLLAIHFFNDNEGYAVGGYWFNPVTSKILYTSDGGDTWVQETSPVSNELYEVFALPAGDVFAIGGGGKVIKKTGSGLPQWIDISPPGYTNEEFWAVHFFNRDSGLVAGGTGFNGGKGIILKTHNGGVIWDTVHSFNQRVNSFSFVTRNIGYAACDGGVILKTTDKGESWSALDNTGFSSRINSICFVNSDDGYFVTSSGSIYYSTNGGASWTNDPFTGGSFLEQVVFPSEGTGYTVGGGGSIVKYEDHTIGFKESVLTEVSFEVYPVLFRDKLNFKYSLHRAGEICITLRNITGYKSNLLLRRHMVPGHHTLSIAEGLKELAPGTYVLELMGPRQKISRKIIKQ